jgi:hypothetical protein
MLSFRPTGSEFWSGVMGVLAFLACSHTHAGTEPANALGDTRAAHKIEVSDRVVAEDRSRRRPFAADYGTYQLYAVDELARKPAVAGEFRTSITW